MCMRTKRVSMLSKQPKGGRKKKTAASEAPEATQAHSSHNLPGKVFLFFSLILNRSSVQMKQPIKITRGSIVIG